MKHIYVGLVCSLLFLLSTSLFAQNPNSNDPRRCQEDGVISLAFSGETELNTCTDDDVMDRVRFQVVPFRQAFAYVVVDAADVIQSIGFSNFINFDLLPPGQLRVYAFSNYGRITASVGDTFSDATLSTPCFGLTTNFVTVNNGQTGDVDINSEQTEYTTCAGDGIDDIINVSSTAAAVSYVVTDEDGNVLAVNNSGELNFEGAGIGICRVYALGTLTIEPGQNISILAGQGGCGGGLSAAFITVNRISISGGEITTTDGETEVLTCPNDGVADLISFTTSGTDGENNRLIVTDAENIIIGLPPGNEVDFDEAGPGVCRVWNLSFRGNFTGAVGDDATGNLADDCNALSSNFVTVVREVPTGGTVATPDGATEVSTCPGDGNDDFVTAVSSGTSGGQVAYLITDSDNNVLGFSTDSGTFNVEGAGVGVCRIWAVTYQGNLTVAEGDNAAETDLADGCFALSDNFVTVTRSVPAGGTIATADGEDEVRTCPGDGSDDIIAFAVTDAEGANNRLVVTDANNVIIGLPPANEVNFEGAGVGVCRVWNLSFNGTFIGEEGDNVTDVLADGCNSVSGNFVTVVRDEAVTGGNITTVDGEEQIQTCPGDGNDDIVSFTVTAGDGENNRLIVTDEENIIIGLPPGNEVNFDGAGVGVCRVWNLSFNGTFSGMVGDDATGLLTDGCSGLSANFVTVVREVPVGGTVATTDGETEVETCPGDGNDDLITAVSSGASGGQVAYLITDSDNNVLGFSADDPTFNVEGAGVGVCRIWVLSYQGNLTVAEGINAAEADLADGCFALSDNFITVTRTVPSGGRVRTVDGDRDITICPGDGVPDVVEFASEGATGSNFTFIITDEDNIILSIPEGNSVDFEEAGNGVCRVWGLAYSGELLAMEGDNAAEAILASDCFSLSNSFLTVIRQLPEGGTVSIEGGATETTVCPGDGIDDIISFVSTGATGDAFAFIVTDNDGVILGLPTGNTLNFEGIPEGICRVYGLAYTGEILANQGDNINEVQLATACGTLSDNFVTVNRESASTGPISLQDGGGTEVLVCPGDAVPDVVRFDSTGTTLDNFNYLIADTNGFVIAVAFTDAFNFENLPEGVCRVYGLGYDGLIRATPGDVLGQDVLATECFTLSENFITVTKQTPEGGTIATDAGLTEVMVCSMDGIPDIVTVVTNSSSGARFIYVATTNENVILSIQDSPTFNFDAAPFGTCRIWGLSYQGNLLALPGDNAAEVQLASGCADLSDNFVTVVREAADGGTVSLADGGDQTVTCPGDGNADVVSFSTTASGEGVLFAATDTNNVILDFFTSEQDFENAGEGICRVWSLAFAGTLTAVPGDTLTTAELATGCFGISDNFITVIREVPDAAGISLEDGTNEISFCSGDPMMDSLTFINNATTAANYTYIIAQQGFALTTVDGNGFDFSNASTGTFTVYGLAYTGEVTVAPGQSLFDTDLSTGCFDLSDTTITINVTKVDAGFILGNGAEELYFCLGGDNDGLVTFNSTSIMTDTNFVYVITTANDIIFNVMDSNSFDFSNIPLEEIRVYAINWTGEFLVNGSTPLNGVLSTECYTISDNFVSIFTDEPEAGEISLEGISGSGIACVVDGDGDITVSTTSTSLTGYAILVTDTANVILMIADDPANVPLGDLPEGDYRLHGLAFTGQIIAQVGDDADVVALASNCYELTEAFINVTRGGEISAGTLTNLSTEGDTITFCSNDILPPIAIVEASVVGPNYRYIVTDDNGIVLTPILPSNIIPFAAFGPGEYRIYGFNFTGTPTVLINQSIEGFLSTECYAVTSNFITVRFLAPDGGTVSTTDGDTEISLEITDGAAVATFMAENTDPDSEYAFVITDDFDAILGVSTDGTVDFGPAGVGVCRVWGLAYTGELTVTQGEIAPLSTLSSECFDLSDNFVTVTRTDNDGIIIGNEEEENEVDLFSVQLSAYPNPTADGVLFLELNSDFPLPEGRIFVRDLNGRAYNVQPVSGGEQSATVRLDISALPSGMYFAQYRTVQGLQSIRFMKR